MKKLVLVMVFVLLAAVFIAFNYLLWDRESIEKEYKTLETTNASYKAEINAQGREIDSLEKEISDQADTISQLTEEKAKLIEEKNGLVGEKDEKDSALRDKINFINTLKQYVDLKVLADPVNKWADALNQGKYEEAYELEYATVAAAERPMSLAAYTEAMQKTIKKIEISEIKIDPLRGSNEGGIYLKVRMNVKLAENAAANDPHFSEGINERYVKVDYMAEKKAFMISSISTY